MQKCPKQSQTFSEMNLESSTNCEVCLCRDMMDSGQGWQSRRLLQDKSRASRAYGWEPMLAAVSEGRGEAEGSRVRVHREQKGWKRDRAESFKEGRPWVKGGLKGMGREQRRLWNGSLEVYLGLKNKPTSNSAKLDKRWSLQERKLSQWTRFRCYQKRVRQLHAW